MVDDHDDWDSVVGDEYSYGGYGQWDDHDPYGEWFSSDLNYHDEFKKRRRLSLSQRQSSLRKSLPWLTVCFWDHDHYRFLLHCARCNCFVSTTPLRCNALRIGCDCKNTSGIPSRYVTDMPNDLEEGTFLDIAEAYQNLASIKDQKAKDRRRGRLDRKRKRAERLDPPNVTAATTVCVFEFINGEYVCTQSKKK